MPAPISRTGVSETWWLTLSPGDYSFRVERQVPVAVRCWKGDFLGFVVTGRTAVTATRHQPGAAIPSVADTVSPRGGAFRMDMVGQSVADTLLVEL